MALELEKITIKGEDVKISEIPELQAYISTIKAEAHKAEKEKLYTKINELQNSIKQLEATPIINTPQQPQSQTAPQVDITSIISGITEAILPKLEASFDVKLREALGPMTKETQFLKESNLNNYRLKLIEENQGKCIAEYVVGNSKEELDDALAKSMELFEKYLPKKAVDPIIPATEKVVEAPIEVPKVTEETPKETPKIVEPPKRQVVSSPEVSDIKGLTPEQFKKNREALRDDIKSLLPS